MSKWGDDRMDPREEKTRKNTSRDLSIFSFMQDRTISNFVGFKKGMVDGVARHLSRLNGVSVWSRYMSQTLPPLETPQVAI